ncbi:MAG: hypothetical protein V2I27_04155 [Erythrobacter sp.]|nr:hypothetical protein [Erythrobacter sp.]
MTDGGHLVKMWLILVVLALATSLDTILLKQFPDPDDVLRLIQVRDLLNGQAWYDLQQYRIDPIGNEPMHWSRLVDLPLAAIILAFRPLLGAAGAEMVALIMVPLLTLLVAVLFIGHIASQRFDREIAGWTVLAAGLLPLLLYQFGPLRVDHHGWQIACFAGCAWGIARSKPALSGMAMGIGLIISIEMLPLAALVGAILALRWLRDPARGEGLAAYLQALAVMLIALFFATRPLAGSLAYCDVITPAHLGFFATVALGATGLRMLGPSSAIALTLGLGASGMAGLALFGWAAPQCLGTPFGSLDPLVHDMWYMAVSEGRPVWEQRLVIIPILLQLSLALGISVHLLAKAPSDQRGWWLEFVMLFAGSFALGLLVTRSLAFASLLATLPLGWLIDQILQRLRIATGLSRKIGIGVAAIAVLLPTAPVALAQTVMPSESAQNASSQLEKSSCELQTSVDQLALLPAGTIFAPLDIGPAILLNSDHTVVATGHHRAEAAMRDVIAAFLAPEDQARAIIADNGADYLVLCSDLFEPANYQLKGGPESLAAQLVDANAPAWLEPISVDAPETFKVWRVRPQLKPE